MRIWLDDKRDPCDYGYPDAVWVKNAIDYKLLLIGCLLKDDGYGIEAIHFDNDLGEETEGYTLFLQIEELAHNGKLPSLKKLFVHTSNPGAAQKFMLAKDSMAKFGIEMIRNHY